MKCLACGSSLAVAGVFPGGHVRCSCGTDNVVPVSQARSSPASPYRKHDDGSHDEPTLPPLPGPAAPGRSHCPRCSRPLEACARSGYPMELCEAGHGLFVETAVLSCMIDEAKSSAPSDPEAAARPALAGSGPVRYVPCPVCAGTMARRNFGRVSGIVVDECADHGTWFDAGELEQSMAFASSGRMQQQQPLRPATNAPEADRMLIDARHAEADELRKDRQMADNLATVVDELFCLLGLGRRLHRW